MKKVLLVCLMTLFCSAPIWAYDFSAEDSNGNEIFYNIIEGAENEVEVTYDYDYNNTSEYGPSYSGNIVIPETVTNSTTGETYTVTAIGASAFRWAAGHIPTSGSMTVTLPSTLTKIGSYAFSNSCIEELDIPEGVTTLEERTFFNSSDLLNVTLPSTITAIPSYCFGNCTNLKNFTIPEGVETIADNVFNACKTITEMTFPNTVTSIGAQAFSNCSALIKVVLGKGLTTFSGTGIFTSCSNLQSVYFLNPTPPTHSGAEFVFSKNETLYVPIGSLSAYQTSFSQDNSYIAAFAEFAEIDIAVADSENDGYATFYHGTYDITLPEGVQAWYASNVEDGEVTLTAVDGSTIPAGNAVLVEASIADYYLDATAATTTTTLSGNMLYGSDEDDTKTSVNGTTDGYYFYKLSTLNGENLGFYWGAENGGAFEITANKAWLAVPTTEGTRALSFKKGESDTTGITTLPATTETTAVNGIYTLQGVRVADMSQKGVYIVNGKKVLVK